MTAQLLLKLPEYLTSLFDAMRDGFVLRSPNGTILDANQSFCRLVGYDRSEIIGMAPPHPWWPPEDDALFRAAHARYLAGQTSEDDLVYLRRTGERVPVTVTSAPLHDSAGRIIGFIGTVKDMSERRRAEQRLRTQYAVTRILAESRSVASAASRILPQVGESLGWDVGVFWSVDERAGDLRPIATWHAPTLEPQAVEQMRHRAHLRRGEGLPGHVWETGAPTWISDVTSDLSARRRLDGLAPALRGAFVFPVHGAERVLGVIEFLSRRIRLPDDDLLTMVATVGNQIGQFIERARAEEALRDSEDRFRTMADNTPALMWTAGPDMGRTFFNRVWLDFVGRSAAHEAGFGWTDHIHRDDYQHSLGVYRRSFEAREPFSVEYRLRRHDGEYRWLLDQGVPRFTADGSFIGYFGSSIDITERRIAEERQRFLAEASTVLASSLDDRVTLDNIANLCVPRLADWCAVDLLEEPGSVALVSVAHIEPAKAEWARTMRARYPVDFDAPQGIAHVLRTGRPELYAHITDELLVAAARDAEHLTLLRAVGFTSAMLVPLRARDHTLGVISFVSTDPARRFGPHDLAFAEELARRAAISVDNARLYKEANDALRARDQFLAVAAHELRSPLTSTKGFAQLLLRRAERSPSGGEWIAPLRTIDNQVNKVATLVGRLLDVSRIQEHRLQLQVEQGDLLNVVREAVADTQLAAERHHILLETEEREVVGEWDSMRVGQVLANLLDNAVKYSPDGGDVVVSVRVEERQVVIGVRDYGVGISPEGRARLFERYFRTDAAARSGSEGMGLGLYVAKGIIDAHDGQMWVESELGQGSTFYFSLPLDRRPSGGERGRMRERRD